MKLRNKKAIKTSLTVKQLDFKFKLFFTMYKKTKPFRNFNRIHSN